MMRQNYTSLWLCCLLILSLPIWALPAWGGIADTRHNLTPSGPGSVKEAQVTELCVFCHTPHNASPQQALWNRDLPGTVYSLYDSSTMKAVVQQPTGTARLCLSCHDGMLALGNLRVPPKTGTATLGPLTGQARLGVDLSDDHPVSFVYDAALALKRGELANPSTLVHEVRLDKSGRVQCTACHEPHENPHRKFLRVDDKTGGLCLTCHQKQGWTGSTHATSTATWNGSGANPWPQTPYTTVADNACESCHRPHSAPGDTRLLSNTQERNVCLVCHSGHVASKNVEAQFAKSSAHPISSSQWSHEPDENPNTMPRHVTCQDCHNPHQVTDATASPPAVSGRLRGVSGLTISGSTIAEANNQYEVCLKCHGVREPTTNGVVRLDSTRNIRLKIDPSNPSYHPIAAVGKNPTVSGFESGTGLSASSMIYCTDCHNNDEQGGTSPKGPHGSQNSPILERNFEMNDPNTESAQSYALCYKCHNRNYLLTDQANTFLHARHVGSGGMGGMGGGGGMMGVNATCAVCHDVHGSRPYKGLINFMRVDRFGNQVVRPSSSGRLEFIDLGQGSGQCYLTCHGMNHNPRQYPGGMMGGGGGGMGGG